MFDSRLMVNDSYFIGGVYARLGLQTKHKKEFQHFIERSKGGKKNFVRSVGGNMMLLFFAVGCFCYKIFL